MDEKNVVTTVSLSDLMGGALEEDFQRSFSAIVENIYDPNTDGKPRELTVKVKFLPQTNGYIEMSGAVTEKLRPSKPLEGALFSKRIKGGRITIHEHIVAQGELDLEEQAETVGAD
jgi:hypothetical protein